MRMNARIYVMRAEDGTLKLGHSRNPAARAKNVGKPVEVIYQSEVFEHAEKIERLAHRVLALHGRHIRGEWFEATLDAAIISIETAVRQAAGLELPIGGTLNTKPKIQTTTFAMRVDDQFYVQLERSRGFISDRASKSDTVRFLVTRYLWELENPLPADASDEDKHEAYIASLRHALKSLGVAIIKGGKSPLLELLYSHDQRHGDALSPVPVPEGDAA